MFIGHPKSFFELEKQINSLLTILMPRKPKANKARLRHKKVRVPRFPFHVKPGPVNCPESLTALEAFLLLFDEGLISAIIADTIHYALQSFLQCVSIQHQQSRIIGKITTLSCLVPLFTTINSAPSKFPILLDPDTQHVY